MTWVEVCHGLEIFRSKGIRLLAITGGEPMLWRDGERGLEDVLAQARHLGFQVISLYTNGTLPLETSADTVFVSLDGLKANSERLRGNFYDTVLENIRRSTHPVVRQFINGDALGPVTDDESMRFGHVK